MDINPIDLPLPELGSSSVINDDILWVRMPLPFELDHINLYLLKDGDGHALVDTGIGTSTTEAHWHTIFDQLGTQLTKVIVTHMHPDHIGMAGWLTEKFKVPLYMSHDEYFVARSIFAGAQGASQWQDEQFYIRCGFDEDYIQKVLSNRKGMKAVIRPIPLSFERLSEGDTIQIGKHNWKIMIGRGHSPEHICLYNEQQHWLISGDHILPKISPNIGVYSTEPNANSLQKYLTTLPQFLELPADTRVFPSHKEPITGLHTRVQELIDHHHNHLHHLKVFCETPRTAIECLPVLFKRELSHHNMFFAIAECLSHLNYLMHSKHVIRRISETGAYNYTATSMALNLSKDSDARFSEEQPLQT